MGILRSRFAVGVAALVIGAGAASAVTYAVADEPETPETFYACKTAAGKIRAGTIRTSTPPSCRTDRGETTVSWSSSGGVSSIDDLVWMPCRVGDPAEGLLEIDYEVSTGAMSLRCPPSTQVTLTVSRIGTRAEDGTVSGGGIDCGATCSVELPYGTVVTLTQSHLPTASFGGWSGACAGNGDCVVEMTHDQEVVGAFDLVVNQPLTVEVEVYSRENGDRRTIVGYEAFSATASSVPDGVECSVASTNQGESLTNACVVEIPSLETVEFVGTTGALGWGTWSGCDSVTENRCTVTLNAARSVRYFAGYQYVVASGSVPDGGACGDWYVTSPRGTTGIRADCTGRYTRGVFVGPDETLYIDAIPDPPHTTVTWNGCPAAVGSVCTINSNAATAQPRPWTYFDF